MPGHFRIIVRCFLSFFLSLAMAQKSTVNIFMPTAYENTIGFAASVMGVCQGTTTYGIRCISGILASDFTCGPDFPEATITEDPATYIATKTTPFSSAVVTLTETCSLEGTTSASCTAKIVISGTKSVSTITTSSVIEPTFIPEYYMYQIPVTAGASLLNIAADACSGAVRTVVTPVIAVVVGISTLALAVLL